MYKFLTKNGQTLAFGLGVVVVAIFLINSLSGIEEFNMMPEEEQPTTTIFNFGLTSAVALIALAALAMLLFGLFHTATDFRGSIKGILGLIVLVAIFFIAYSSASGEATGAIAEAADKAGGLTENNLKFIGGGITTTLILVLTAAAAFVISEVINLFK